MIDRNLEIERKRRKRNRELVERMKQGDPLQGDSLDTWFPDRPIQKHDLVQLLPKKPIESNNLQLKEKNKCLDLVLIND